MVAFFVRRLIGGVAMWLVATFVFYSLLVSPSLPIDPKICNDCVRQEVRATAALEIERAIFAYSLDKPWPANYLTWLFDPNGTTRTISPAEVIFGRQRSPQRLILVRSGLLAGDFGYSWEVATGKPSLEVYGLNLTLFPLSLASLLGLMLIAVLQRRHRPYAWGSTRIPANARWRPAELWTMG
jgi:hypothetical protein